MAISNKPKPSMTSYLGSPAFHARWHYEGCFQHNGNVDGSQRLQSIIFIVAAQTRTHAASCPDFDVQQS